MPRLIDYVGRFEFIRQAAFAVVRDDGVDALSRRRVAAELGTGVNTIRRSVADWVDLVRLAADHVVARRRLGRFGRQYDETPREVAARLVRSLMPDGPAHLDEELVWLRMVTACALRPSGLEPPGQLRREFGIAQRGYDDGLPTPEPASEPATEERPAGESRGEALQQYLEEREQEVSSCVDRVLDLLDVTEPRTDTKDVLIALIEGLTLSACRARLTPERATELAVAHTLGLARDEAGEPDAAA
jgi:hypothetical protein